MRRVLSRFQRFWWVTVPCLLLTLTACAGEPVKGHVVEKDYDDADTWVYMQPQYSTSCRTVNKTTSCSQTLTGTIPVTMFDPEHYVLRVEDAEGKVHGVNVNAATWEATEIGDYFDEVAR